MPADTSVGGIRASAASLVLHIKHRLRHERRAGAFVYTASDPIAHVYLLIHKMQKGRSLTIQTSPLVNRYYSEPTEYITMEVDGLIVALRFKNAVTQPDTVSAIEQTLLMAQDFENLNKPA